MVFQRPTPFPCRQILVAAIRALAQLLLVGAALTLVISAGRSIWWSWLWVAAMVG
jgi:UDP-glucose/iron transport system permease protein